MIHLEEEEAVVTVPAEAKEAEESCLSCSILINFE
jgi:hypothetical protein